MAAQQQLVRASAPWGARLRACAARGLTAASLIIAAVASALPGVIYAATTSTTTLAVSPSPATVGSNATLTATVTGSSPTGTVTFKDGTTTLGTGTVSAGKATLTKAFTTAGTHSLTAVYAGDTNNTASTSSVKSLTVNQRSTTTALSVSPSPATVGASVTLTATITGTNVSGTVTFKDGTTTLGTGTVASGKATLSTNFTTVGTHSLTAVYAGDANNKTSTSSAKSLTVNKRSTTTALAVSANPATTGANVVLTATITGTNTSGTVTFKDGTTTLGTGTISAGQATLTKAFTTAGTHSLTAVYGGDTNNNNSTSSALSLNVVTPVSTTTALSATPSPATLSGSVTLSATVTGSSPSGTVTFKDGSTTLGTGALSGGTATVSTSFAVLGSHSLTAVYGGDTANLTSTSSAVSLTVNPASTTTTLTATPNPVGVGQTVALTASVAGASPSGTVTFTDGGTTIGTATLTNGSATFTTTYASAGTHTLAAVYGGDTNNAASTSANLSVSAQVLMTWNYGYDAEGNLTTVTDANNRVTTTTYDSLNRPKTTTLPAPTAGGSTPVITTTYDGLDQPKQVTDPRSLSTTYTTDGLGNTTGLVSPDTGTSSATFDVAGNLTSRTDARGKITTYTYDARNRLKTITYASGTPTVVEYDGGSSPYAGSIGRVTGLTDETGSTQFTYDAASRPIAKTQVTNGRSFTVSYTWGDSGSALNKLVTLTYPSGAVVTYGYGSDGRVSQVSVTPAGGAATTVLTNLAYTVDGQVLSWTWGDGSPYQRSYDAYGRLTGYPLGKLGGAGNAAGVWRTVGHDAGLNINAYTHVDGTGAAQPVLDQGFTLDGLDRLTGATNSSTSYGYAYDASGNRTQRTIGGNTYTNTIDAASNRLATVQVPGLGTVTYTYDNAGNLTGDGRYTYAYSDRGRLQSATSAAGSVSYRYNALEQRVWKTGSLVSGTHTYYVYDGQAQLLGEYDASGAARYETIYLAGTPIAALVPAPGTTAPANQLAYAYADQIDTVRVLTRNTDQTIVWRWDSAEPFGATPPAENPSTLGATKYHPRFPGQVYDTETANVYNLNRTYDPDSGRYTQSDPIGLNGGINTYAYVGGAPLILIDPTGTTALGDAGAFFGRWGGRLGGAVVGEFIFPTGGGVPGALIGGQVGDWGGRLAGEWLYGQIFPMAAADSAGNAATGDTSEKVCTAKQPCPPCRTVSGKIVPVGTIGYRPLDVIPDDETQHGVAGSHHNIFIANQNPNNCQCFWAKQHYVLKPSQLPMGAVPVEPFVN